MILTSWNFRVCMLSRCWPIYVELCSEYWGEFRWRIVAKKKMKIVPVIPFGCCGKTNKDKHVQTVTCWSLSIVSVFPQHSSSRRALAYSQDGLDDSALLEANACPNLILPIRKEHDSHHAGPLVPWSTKWKHLFSSSSVPRDCSMARSMCFLLRKLGAKLTSVSAFLPSEVVCLLLMEADYPLVCESSCGMTSCFLISSERTAWSIGACNQNGAWTKERKKWIRFLIAGYFYPFNYSRE